MKHLRIRWLTLAAGAACCCAFFPSLGEEIRIATYEYTDNWNPVAHTTYPGQIVTTFATEHLFVRRCANQKILNENRYEQVCQQDSIDGVQLALNISEQCQITADDVKYSVEQIKQVRFNDFYAYDLEVLQPNSTETILSSQQKLDNWQAQNAFSFPVLLRAGGKQLHQQQIGPGQEQLFNSATSGKLQLGEIADNRLTMLTRTTGEPRARIDYFNITNELLSAMARDDRPEVVLALPFRQARSVSEDWYKPTESSALNNFMYVGFNFNVRDPDLRDLMNDLRFRTYIAQSFWTAKPFADLMNIHGENPGQSDGIFLGQSFTTRRSVNVPRDIPRLERQIQDYLQQMQMEEDTQLTLLFPPLVHELFSANQQNAVLAHLNDLWGSERFRIITPTDRAGFRRQRADGKYDLILDTFFHGLNHLQYVAFLTPNAPQNDLGIRLIRNDEIDQILKDGDRGLVRLDALLVERYPVAVIGTLKLRNFYAPDLLQRDKTSKTQCGPNEYPVPLAILTEGFGSN
jgi:hypothetical protein